MGPAVSCLMNSLGCIVTLGLMCGGCVGPVPSPAPLGPLPGSGWYVFRENKSCKEECEYDGRPPCNVGPMRQLVNIDAVRSVLATRKTRDPINCLGYHSTTVSPLNGQGFLGTRFGFCNWWDGINEAANSCEYFEPGLRPFCCCGDASACRTDIMPPPPQVTTAWHVAPNGGENCNTVCNGLGGKNCSDVMDSVDTLDKLLFVLANANGVVPKCSAFDDTTSQSTAPHVFNGPGGWHCNLRNSGLPADSACNAPAPNLSTHNICCCSNNPADCPTYQF